ncbi:MAG: alanine racemase, partial [Longimicrobiales bacterium]
ITVAKLGEAEVMADAGLQEILLAYPVVGDQKVRRLASLAERISLTVSVDSVSTAREIARAAKERGVRIGTLVEFDTGFGRCGLPIAQEAMSVVSEIVALPCLDFQGVLVYPGHFLVGPEERERLLETENERLRLLVELLQAEGLQCQVVSGGSTPTAYMAHRFVGINEIRAGTYIFNDGNEVGCGAATYEECAVSVLTTVVSTSVAGRAVVDGGSKTLSSDGLLTGNRTGYGYVREDAQMVLETLSEEHGQLDVSRATRRVAVGDRLRIVPNHVCPCVNLHESVYGVEGETVVVEWRVDARGRVR